MAEELLAKITKVEKKRNKYLVYINNDVNPITMTEDQIVQFRIIKGNSFFEHDWNTIMDSLDEGKLFDKTLKYIDFKPRTEKEIKEYLEDKSADDVMKNSIIDKLKSISFINDDRYAKNFVEENIKNQNGPKVINYKLLEKGVNQAIIDKYIVLYTKEMVYNNAVDMAKKTLKTLHGLPVQKQKESIYSRLLRMGYDYGVIQKVLSILTYHKVDIKRLKKEYDKIISKESDKNKIITKLLSKGYDYSDIKKVMSGLDDEIESSESIDSIESYD